MRDGHARRAIKQLALGAFHLRLVLHRMGADVRYELGGECIRCAKCCEAPAIRLGFLAWYLPVVRRLVLHWHRHVNGFELAEARRRERTLVFRCSHFDWKTRQCDSYESRPGMCRDYPLGMLEQPAPAFFDGCGYKALAPNREQLVQILEQQHLSPAQMEKLRKGLFLEE